MTFLERFWSRVQRGDDSACWFWQGGKTPLGYGAIWREGRNHGAHRVSWELAHGRTIPSGMCVCHTCDTPACVNPRHLFLGTLADNNHDMRHKGRHVVLRGDASPSRRRRECLPRGVKHWNAKLSDDDVRQVLARCRSGETQRTVAQRFGVDPSLVSQIVNGKRWAHVHIC